MGLISDDNSTVLQNRSSRLTVFNGYTGDVKLVDLGTSLNVTGAPVVIDTLAPGQSSEVIYEPEGTVNWAFVDAANPETVLYRMDNYNVLRDTSGAIVLTQQRVFKGRRVGCCAGWLFQR